MILNGNSGNEIAQSFKIETARASSDEQSEVMALSGDDLAQIEALLVSPDAEAQPFSELRRRFPHLSWTSCDASDVNEEPFRQYGRFEIHLLDSADHCSHITSDPSRATGVVLARRSVVS